MAKKSTFLHIEISADARAATKDIKKLGAEMYTAARTGRQRFKHLSQELLRAGDAAKMLGRDLRTYVTIPLVLVGAAAIKVAADFEHAFAEVRTLLMDGSVNIQQMETDLRALAQVVPQTIGELTRGLYQLISAGVRGQAATKALDVAARAAVAGVTDADTAVRGLAKTMNAYGIAAEDAEMVADMLFETVNLGNVTFEELSNAIGTVVGTAAQAKVPMAELFAAIAIGSRVMKNADVVTTSLNQAILGFISPSKGALAVAKEFGFNLSAQTIRTEGLLGAMRMLSDLYDRVEESGGDALTAIADMIPNIRALRAVTAVTGAQMEKYVETTDRMENSVGQMNKAFEIMSETLINKVKLTFATLQEVLIRFGTIVIPTLKVVLELMRDFLQRAREWPVGIKGIIVAVTLLVAALGPLVIVVGALISNIGKLLPLLPALRIAFTKLLGPIGLILLGLEAFHVALLFAFKGVDRFIDKIKESNQVSSRMINAIKVLREEQRKQAAEQIDAERAARRERDAQMKLADALANIREEYRKRSADISKAAESERQALLVEQKQLREIIDTEEEFIVISETEVEINERRLRAFERLFEIKKSLQKLDKEEAELFKTSEAAIEAYNKEYQDIIAGAASRRAGLEIERRQLKSLIANTKEWLSVEGGLFDVNQERLKSVRRLKEIEQEIKNLDEMEQERAEAEADRIRRLNEQRLAAIEEQKRAVREMWRENNKLLLAMSNETIRVTINTLFQSLEPYERYTDERLQLEKIGLDRRRQALQESLADDEITQQEFNLRMIELDREWSDARRQHEEQNANFMKRLWRGLADAYKDILQNMLTKFLQTKTEEILYTKFAEKAKAKEVVKGAGAQVAAASTSTLAWLKSAGAAMIDFGAKVLAYFAPLGPIGIGLAAGTIAAGTALYLALKNNMGFAKGGMPSDAGTGKFTGKGTGTSDSNVVAVSDGEYIVNAKATRKNLALLEAINTGKNMLNHTIKGFAEGGVVGNITAPGGGNTNQAIVNELRSIRLQLSQLQPQVVIEGNLETTIRGRDLYQLVRLEEKSAAFRTVGS